MQQRSHNTTSREREIRRVSRGDDFDSCQKMRSEDRSEEPGRLGPVWESENRLALSSTRLKVLFRPGQ